MIHDANVCQREIRLGPWDFSVVANDTEASIRVILIKKILKIP